MHDKTKEIIEHFRRDGSISPESAASAEFGVWDRVTPGWITFATLKALTKIRWEKGESAAEQVPMKPIATLSRGDATLVVKSFLGDISAMREVRARGLITLASVVGLLSGMIEEDELSEQQMDVLLEFGEESCREILRTGDPLHPTLRGVEVGPWDVSEAPVLGPDRIDLGGLRIPSPAGLEIQPMRDGADILAVTAILGSTAIQLQAFHARDGSSWEIIRHQMKDRMQAQGGVVKEWAGTVGVELRAKMPVTNQSGRRAIQDVKILGRDGPRWILRGIVTGLGADADSRDEWPYEMFMNTVVVPDFSNEQDSGICLQWPRPAK
ncbi:DUF3710 domain-containing protein [Streptomyces sp. NPDC006703]|uniref:DUF3710 domain-containing protein n=1 Tax=Streptomyces sp. NPDC006703 TaxID=3364759 RepID=UPI0036BF6133